MNVAHLLSERAASCGPQPAIIDESAGRPRRATFAGLEQAAAATTATLRTAGLEPGDSVLVLQPMSLELYVVLIALLRQGLVAMFLDPGAGRHHLDHCCAVHAPKAFIGSRRAHLLRLLSPALRRVPIKFSTSGPVPGAWALWRDHGPKDRNPIHESTPETPALIRFTTGSTGLPKAAMRTHGFLLEQQRVLARSLRLVPGEVDLATLPIFVLANLAAGVTSLIPNADLRAPGSIDPGKVVRQIQQHAPQRTGASPAFLERIANHCVATGQRLQCLRKIFTGGGPVFPDLLDRLHTVAPEADIVAVYGSTEAEPIAHIRWRDITPTDRVRMSGGHGLLAGFPDDAIELRILQEGAALGSGSMLDLDPQSVSAARGEPGQIVVTGPHVQPGYLNGIGDAETKFRTRGATWHRTGDAGYLDEQGRLWLLGRSNDRIQDRHGTLYPFQVECAARQHPGVHRAAFLLHDRQRVLALEAGNRANLTDLRRKLAWAAIDRIAAVRCLPVDARHNAKVDYRALRKRLDGFCWPIRNWKRVEDE